MAICRYFQQGNCRYGNNCRFEHPGQGGFNRNASPGSGSNNSLSALLEKYNIHTEVLEKDLTTEAPQWILSSYAPGRNPPEQLFGGFPREQSFEEMRLMYYMAKATGTEQQALNEAQELYRNAEQQMQNAARNSRDAARFIIEADAKHPNRNDLYEQAIKGQPSGVFARSNNAPTPNPFATNTTNTQAQPSAFGGGANSGASTFGQPSALGQRPNPFGNPSFGQPAQPSASAFGKPSQPAFGQTGFAQAASQPQSAFGQPSQSKPAFGQPSQPGPTSTFGQPSALGAKPNPFGAPTFGQPSQPNTQSTFGQPSQLGQNQSPFASAGAASNNNAAPNPFSNASTNSAPAAPNPFGSNNNNNNTQNTQSPFGQQAAPSNPFGQASTTNTNPNPFASANQTNNTPAASNPFAQKTDQPSGFAALGTQPQQQNQGFNQPTSNSNVFGQKPAAPNPFGQPSQPTNAFGSNQPAQPAAAAQASASGSPYPPGSSRQHPAVDSYVTKGMNGRLTGFKSKPVTYKGDIPGIRGFDGTWSRIWFPSGPPGYNKDTELPPGQYDDKSKAQWAAFAEKGAFADGLMPELPPPREVTTWDF